jgi:hypothetical protein
MGSVNEAIVTRSEDVFVRVGGRRIQAFPVAGNYVDIEKASAVSTPVEGQHGNLGFAETNGNLHTVTIQVMPGTADDAFMGAALTTQRLSNLLLPVSIEWNDAKYVSGSGRLTVRPTRSLAGDSLPPIAYVIAGSFPIALVKAFIQPATLTEDQINANIGVSA